MPLEILYLDDESDLCEIFSDTFNSDDIKVRTFTSYQLAIEDAHRAKPDIIFVDYRLPGITGDEVAKSMPAGVPKILLTGDNLVETTYKFTKIFNKPWRNADIHEIIQSVLQSKKVVA